MLQDRVLIAGEPRKHSEIWFSYHWEAIKATRKAVSLEPTLKVREERTDECLACNQYRLPDQFSKSLLAVVMCVFVMEYRVNQKAKQQRIWNKSCSYFDRCGIRKRAKKFKCLGLYEKWRNIVEFSEKTLDSNFGEFVESLLEWIDIRNRIAHGNPDEIANFQISPEKALSCYNTMTKAIFKLNTALCYGTEDDNDRHCKTMLL